MPENNLGTSNKATPHKHWYEKTIREILDGIKEFFFDLFDLKDGMDAVSYTHLTLPTICSV